MNDIEFGRSLYKLYHSAVKLEAADVKDNKNCADLTVNELNLIECIRSLTKGSDGPTISSIATELDITRPSTTVAVNKLVNKKIVTKTECANDGRSVRVKLTAKGEKAYSAHHSYQNALAKEVKQYFSESDYKTIESGISKLLDFFTSKAENVDSKD